MRRLGDLFHQRSGTVTATGVMYANRATGKPSRLGPSYHDQFAGCYAVMSILAALVDPSAPSERRNIELGLYETGLHIAARDLVGVQLKSQMTGKPEQEPSPEFSMPGYGAYETSDGRWAYLVMLTDDHWRRFCMAANITPDPEFVTLRHRRKRRAEVEAIVARAVGNLPYDEIAARLAAAGVGFTEVLSADRVLDAPQANEPMKYSEIPFAGFNFQAPNFPLPAFTRQTDLEEAPPLLGEHTISVLRSVGYSESDVNGLIDVGVVLPATRDSDLWNMRSEPQAAAG
ncbi:CoA transferase [Rhizobium sp. SYY.PMSO]|uniref:CoA transferase n=1 Tax=Rhizobium sp. SYY.PMSO TaxID=3382192 RepID=UPI00398FF0C4